MDPGLQRRGGCGDGAARAVLISPAIPAAGIAWPIIEETAERSSPVLGFRKTREGSKLRGIGRGDEAVTFHEVDGCRIDLRESIRSAQRGAARGARRSEAWPYRRSRARSRSSRRSGRGRARRWRALCTTTRPFAGQSAIGPAREGLRQPSRERSSRQRPSESRHRPRGIPRRRAPGRPFGRQPPARA